MQRKLASLAVRSIVPGEAFPERTTWYYGVLTGETPEPKAHPWHPNKIMLYRHSTNPFPLLRLRPPLTNTMPGDEVELASSLIQLRSDCSLAQRPTSCAVLSSK